jgi:hypothetical protein
MDEWYTLESGRSRNATVAPKAGIARTVDNYSIPQLSASG